MWADPARLRGVVRPYAWGSRSVIAAMQGRPVPSPTPEAELWLGAHPAAPATAELPGGPASLAALIDADPAGLLGPGVSSDFGGRLPYLLKVLAAETPLSLQAHPDADRARAGYAAGHPCYVDDSHKPELLVAVTDFDALCGFRPPAESAAALAALGVPELAQVVTALRGGVPGLPVAVRTLLSWPVHRRRALVTAAAGAGAEQRHADDLALVRRLAAHYPDDPGVLVALLLHRVRLAPGEAIWMPAGNLHAYLHGAGVEIMAASDNVLRGGLTPKRVDVDELLRVLRFEVLDEPVVRPEPVCPGVVTWPVPAQEFTLHQVRLDDAVPHVTIPGTGPRIALCTAGGIAVDGLALRPGEAAFVTPTATPTLSGAGVSYVASVGG